MLVPLAVQAAPKPPKVDWHRCSQNEDCVLVEGTCNKAAVNVNYQDDATYYYKALAKTTKCPQNFWTPKAVGAQCRLQQCEIIGEEN